MAILHVGGREAPFLLAGQEGQMLALDGFRLSSSGGNRPILLGPAGGVRVGMAASARAELTPVTPGDPRIRRLGLAQGMPAPGLLLELGASASASAQGNFRYAALEAGMSLDLEGGGGFAYLRPGSEPLDLFRHAKLPEQVDGPLLPGEAIALEYGGYLRLAADFAAGYRLSSTETAQQHGFGIFAKAALEASVAGYFRILMTADPDREGWVRIRVTRRKRESFAAAADVAADLSLDAAGSAEFLAAAVGADVRSYLAVVRTVEQRAVAAGAEALSSGLDGLARKFLQDLIGSANDPGAVSRILRNITASYEAAGDHAVALFDRYFEKLEPLRKFLRRIADGEISADARLRAELAGHPEAWAILAQLADGDPLAYVLGDAEALVRERAERTLALIEDPPDGAHREIRRLVALAKEQFGFDRLLDALLRVDSVDELKSLAHEKAGLLAARLTGRKIDSKSDLKKAVEEIRAVRTKIDSFGSGVASAIREALAGSWKLSLHAGYSASRESDALVDASVRMDAPGAVVLVRSAGRGDLALLLRTALANPDVAVLREGVFTHRVERKSAFQATISGWRAAGSYESFSRLVTEVVQRLQPDAEGTGRIHMKTSVALELERVRQRRDEEMHVHFLLRALGASAGVLAAHDGEDAGFLIEELRQLTARYQLGLGSSGDTSEEELDGYLELAREFGLDAAGARKESLLPLLPRTPSGGFGKVLVSYDIRFGQESLDALLRIRELTPGGEAAIRAAMRRNVLANYQRAAGETMANIAYAYATSGLFDFYRQQGAGFANRSALEVRVLSGPGVVVLDRHSLRIVDTLYRIEESMVRSIRELYQLLGAGKPVDPKRFADRLRAFGRAMRLYDDFDQASNRNGVGASTIFVMFDALVRLANGGRPAAGGCALRLTSEAEGRKVEKIFLVPSGSG